MNEQTDWHEKQFTSSWDNGRYQLISSSNGSDEIWHNELETLATSSAGNNSLLVACMLLLLLLHTQPCQSHFQFHSIDSQLEVGTAQECILYGMIVAFVAQ